MESKKVRISVVALEEAMTAMIQGINSPKLPYATAYWIGRNLRSIRAELEPMAEQKGNLLNDYRLKDEKENAADAGLPGAVKLDPGRAEEYWRELAKLNKLELEFSIWPINHNLLRDKEEKLLEIKPSDLACLDFLLEGDIPEDDLPSKRAVKEEEKTKK